ncbi:hypothetical protein JST97_05945 [bacterium]|nr:hypothetical protein [bacterium]
MKNRLFGFGLGLSLLSSAGADTTIHFDRGKFSKTVHGAVVRGTTEKFWVGAGKGQKMTVRIRSLENNAVFQVVGDGGELSKPEQTQWSGTLPIKGDYLIEVGPTRGNATFDLTVEIR